MDLYVRYGTGPDAAQMAFELKVWRDGRPEPLAQGLQQLDDYMAGLSYEGRAVESGWLVIFDQRSHQPEISERTSAEQVETPSGRSVMLIRA